MKQYIIFLALAIVSSPLCAQRMVYKQKSLEINTGLLNTDKVGKNFYINLTLNSFSKHGNYWIWGLEYQKKAVDYKNWEIPLENYFGEVGYSIKLLSDSKKFITLNGALTGVAGYESVNRGDSILLDGGVLKNQNGFVFGTGGRLSLETYISDRVVFMVQSRIRILWGTDLEKFRPLTGIGLRFNF
ncbi:conjugal transfer protein TraO [Sphingobacterium multivorum]|uniref:conjugal transfer protein TraO n=1 Tax=Sphingobacterium multivorum TaxID=28454 RepID=UPI0028A04725|nr:conjugal transfer protein TraO [Sphingobacterium multivorum]